MRVTVKMLREENAKLGAEVRRLREAEARHAHELTAVANLHNTTGRLLRVAKETEEALHLLQHLFTPGLRALLKDEEE